MLQPSINSQIIESLQNLSEEDKLKVLEFVHKLEVDNYANPSSNLEEFFDVMSDDEADEIKNSISEERERVFKSEWE